jgi:hypothetical protein
VVGKSDEEITQIWGTRTERDFTVSQSLIANWKKSLYMPFDAVAPSAKKIGCQLNAL